MRFGVKFDNGLKKKTSQLGFTLIEAIISLLVFGISFAGLFLLFGIAQQTAINAEKRMFLNLMANRIVENIANEGTNVNASINPFNNQTYYHGSLDDCSIYGEADVPNYQFHWCTDLQNQVGGVAGSAGEERMVSVVKEANGDLYVDVILVVDGGMSGRNLVRAYFSRRLRRGQI